MTYKFLPDVALADIAFRAEGSSANELFETCARALTEVMVDARTVKKKSSRTITVTADDYDRLLYDFLTELIIVKDVDSLLFSEFNVEVSDDGKSLSAQVGGEPIDRERHELRNDVKAVTMHMFGIVREGGKWSATVVLDI